MSGGIFRASGQGRSFPFGTVAVVVKLEQEEIDDSFALVEATFPAGLPGPPRHRHPWYESFYLLSGELHFTVGDDRILARPGDLVHATPGVPHTYANAGSEPATAIGLFTPGHFLAALEEIATAFPPGGGPQIWKGCAASRQVGTRNRALIQPLGAPPKLTDERMRSHNASSLLAEFRVPEQLRQIEHVRLPSLGHLMGSRRTATGADAL